MLTDEEKTGVSTFVPDSYLMDFRGRITVSTISMYLLQTASEHAANHGFGYSDMTKQHTTWVLSRLAVEVNEYPDISGPISVYTGVDEINRLFTSRCFEWKDQTGKTLGFARSIWAAIDLQTRKPTTLDQTTISHYLCNRSCPIDKPGKIVPAEQHDAGMPYQLKYSDLDINGHFNSIKYIEHMLDLFDLKLFSEKEIRRFEIEYKAEGMYGMELMLHKHQATDAKYALPICLEGNVLSSAAVTWQ